MSIPVQDQSRFYQILEDSLEVDYIRPPLSYMTYWQGRQVEQRGMLQEGRERSGFCCISYLGRFGRIDDELAILIGSVFFVASPFIALAYTTRSLRNALKAKQDLQDIQSHHQRSPLQAEAVHLSSNQELSSQPHYSALYPDLINENPLVLNGSQPQEELETIDYYAEAEILLKGRYMERKWVALSQASVTVGAGLLTIALLATFIAGELIFFELGAVGIGLIFTGALLYSGTRCTLLNNREQEAASRISNAFLTSSPIPPPYS